MTTYQAGQKLLCGEYTAYTPTGKSLFVKAGRWHKSPQAGDIVYFYHASMGRVAHVGIVAAVERTLLGKLRITTLEGNTAAGRYSRDGGCVAEKTYTVSPGEVGGGHLVDGFGRPQYGDDTCTAEELIAVARGEIGYVEKASPAQLDSKLGNPGTANYTRYGAWYGMNAVPWCQEYVSWCAYMACKRHRERAHTGWQRDAQGWTYTDENGRRLAGEWAYIGGRWYVFDESGHMITGWFKSAGDWYYLAGDGGMLAGQWLEDKGAQYYLAQSGMLVRRGYVKGRQPTVDGAPYYYYVDAEGRWDSTRDTETLPAGEEAAV